MLSRRAFIATAGAVAIVPASSATTTDEFRDVPNAYRMRMHWYVFGPAWEAAECERQMARMAAQHIGGVLIFPTYPIAVDDPARGIRNQQFLSTEFLDVLRSVTAAARRMGLTVDIVLGTGWPFGGPTVAAEDGAQAIRKGPNGFASAPTGMKVKRASLGAEGLVLDHYNRAALDRYLAAVGDKIVSVGGIRSIFCDSFEVYRASWTAKMPEAFASARGYELTPARLEALFDGAHADSRDVRCDFWRTLSELAETEFVKPLGEWAHKRGVTTQVESYGTPPVSLASYRWVDVPVGEHYEWKEFSTSRWASSGAHLAGKPVVLAEAWTWTKLPNRFADTLEDLKLCSDLHFLCGINALYGLTYAYSPEALGSPGWVPYFGPAVNHTSPYWPYFSHLADYVNRASYVLQQGRPVAEIGVYLPAEDSMADNPPEQLLLNWAVRDRLSSNGVPPEFSLENALHFESNVVKTIVTNGYAFDGVDAFTLPRMDVAGSHLRLGDCDFAAVVLPNLTGIDLPALRKIAEFVRAGGCVIATRRVPETAWGLRDRDANRAAVRALVGEMFGVVTRDSGYAERAYGKGRAIFVPDELGSLRKALGVACAPDVRFHGGTASEHVSFVHRRTADRDFYFVANTSGTEAQRIDAEFRCKGCVPERWRLESGASEAVRVYEPTEAGVRLRFTLGPRESRVYAFAPGTQNPVAFESDLDEDGRAWSNGRFYVRGPRGRRRAVDVSGLPAPAVLAPAWTLSFEGPGSAVAPVKLDALSSWTEIRGARFFSGRGDYEAEFQNPFAPGGELGVVLDLGAVRETADVSVNGTAVGVAWMRPFRLDVSAVVRRGRNRVRVAVTNLLINKILGDGPIDYSAVVAKYGNRFPAGEEWEKVREPFPSGLLGPVRLVYYRRASGGEPR